MKRRTTEQREYIPRRDIFANTFLTFASTIAAVLVLILPFIVLQVNRAVILTFIIGTIMPFILGSNVGKTGPENPYKEGLKCALLAMLGAIVSHLIADCIQLLI